MHKYAIQLLTIITLFISTTIQAALITETWKLEVTGERTANTSGVIIPTTDPPIWTIGDIFTVTITYDNTSTRMSDYRDGPNKIAEFGKGDDTFYRMYCGHLDPDYENTTVCSKLTNKKVLATAPIDGIDKFIESITAAGLTLLDDYYPWNYARRQTSDFGHNTAAILQDVIVFDIADGYQEWSRFFTTDDKQHHIQLLSTLVSTRPAEVPVPVPAPLALMGLGLLGLGYIHRRKA